MVRALNPYSIQLNWMAPILQNGLISHYIINIVPQNPNVNAKPWTINVASNQAHLFYLSDGSESILPVNDSNSPSMDAIVDNLIGGKSYQISVVGVTEAGSGEIQSSNESVEILMPIAGIYRKLNYSLYIFSPSTPSISLRSFI